MPESTGTYLDSSSADTSDLELKAVIAVLAQRVDALTDRVDRLDPEVANQQFLEEQREALAARSRQVATEAETQRESATQAESRRIAQNINERTLPLASARSISKLYRYFVDMGQELL